MQKVILSICLILLLFLIPVYFISIPANSDFGWNLYAEIIGVIITLFAVTLVMDIWRKGEWRPIQARIKKDIELDICIALNKIVELFGNKQEIAQTLTVRLGGMISIDVALPNVKKNYHHKINELSLPGSLREVHYCFEQCRGMFYERFKEYEFYLTPDILSNIHEIRDKCLFLSMSARATIDHWDVMISRIPKETNIKCEKERLERNLTEVLSQIEGLYSKVKDKNILKEGI